jgi:hypothetical protein
LSVAAPPDILNKNSTGDGKTAEVQSLFKTAGNNAALTFKAVKINHKQQAFLKEFELFDDEEVE